MKVAAPRNLGFAVVASLIVAGVAWRECLLLAAAAAAGHRLFLWRMDLDAPWSGWRAGIRCCAAGLAGLAAAFALFVLVGFMLLGVLRTEHPHPVLSVALIAAAAVLVASVRRHPRDRRQEAGHWVALVVLAALAFAAARATSPALPCIATGLVAGWLGWASWNLARGGGSALLAEQ
ncbi:hypothetical protein M6I34_11540 [Burkholderiaceae bacterium FT117]|uniref:hypothetical protein n=1 Tax=Zeimonas sediminis TaxID=2944268 RepID=UPI002342E266|nr:hypothetical protein [Zeimonas sediminis]MCM5571139.1 hypothetical protein [Zeimonas sediminis]